MKKLIFILLILGGICVALSSQNFNVDKAVTHLNEHALSRSHNCCAWFVMRALNAGGCNVFIFPAYMYSNVLPHYNFEEVKTNHYEKGDVVVFPKVKGHPYGHIAMWNGNQWVSDFKQKGMIVNKAYKNVTYKVFRHKNQ